MTATQYGFCGQASQSERLFWILLACFDRFLKYENASK